MKIFLVNIIILLSHNFILCANLQLIPKSYNYSSNLFPITNDILIDKKITYQVNSDYLFNFERELNTDGKLRPAFYGVGINVNASINNSGTWDTLENGGKIWRLKTICPGAFSINFAFSKFHLLVGDTLFIYNQSHSQIIGPYTIRNNNLQNKFSTFIVAGDTVIIELFKSNFTSDSLELELFQIVYGYKNIYENIENEFMILNNKNNNNIQSLSCERDANCPEGHELCREKYSVAIIQVPYLNDSIWGWCSGSLINNTQNSYRPFFLTAFHCLDLNENCVLEQSEIGWANSWHFSFGYMREGCNYGFIMPIHEYEGSNFISGWSGCDGTDFLLLELQDQPKPGEDNFPDVFFNGWDRTGEIPVSTKCLHHPVGDLMKISVDNDAPHIILNNKYWSVNWNSGTVEHGSSGSPLFRPNRLVIGQLSGSPYEPSCDTTQRYYYGRLSESWYGGGTDETSLHHWLDIDNTGVTTLAGIHLPNNQYGMNFDQPSPYYRKAYDLLRVGSGIHYGITSPFRVESGTTLTLKAGKEIHIRPCTQIISGSIFHAYIEELDCSEIVYLSDKDEDYMESCGFYELLFSNIFDCNTPHIEEIYNNSDNLLYIYPNPGTNTVKISYSLSSASYASLSI